MRWNSLFYYLYIIIIIITIFIIIDITTFIIIIIILLLLLLLFIIITPLFIFQTPQYWQVRTLPSTRSSCSARQHSCAPWTTPVWQL